MTSESAERKPLPITRHEGPGLRTGITLLVVVLMLVPLLTAAYLAISEIQQARDNDRKLSLQNAVSQARDTAIATERRALTTATLLSSNVLLESYLREITNNNAAASSQLLPLVSRELTNFQRSQVDHAAVALFDPDGWLLIAQGNEKQLNALMPVIRRVVSGDGPQHIEWLRCPGLAAPCLLIVNKIFLESLDGNARNTFRGALALLTSPESLGFLGQRFTEDFGGELYAVDNNGLSWFKSNTPVTKLPANSETEPTLREGDSAFAQSIRVSDNLWISGALPVDADGRVRGLVGSFTRAAFLGVALCILLMVWALHRMMLSPIEKLKKTAEAMAAGNLEARFPALRANEIGDLGLALHRMQQRVVKSNTEIRKLAFTDTLTGLQNRAMFSQVLDFLVQHSDPEKDRHTLIFLDLDKFKQVNDSNSHAFGDTVLQRFAERLSDHLNKLSHERFDDREIHLARFGGDEFQIAAHNIESLEQAGEIANGIREALADPLYVDGIKVYTPASIGIALYPDDGLDTETLVRNAEIAMYSAKQRGGDTIRFCSDELNKRAAGKLELQVRLREAIANHGLSLNFQPKIDIRNGRLIGAEVLCRWHDAKLGTVPPDKFIEIAEEHGMINALTEWLIDASCEILARWTPLLPEDFNLALNASSQDLYSESLLDAFDQATSHYQVDPKRLTIELTETGLIKALHNPATNLAALRKKGVRISLDDFGTGYSSLSYLRELPIDELKLDRSFLKDIDSEEDALSVVEAVADLASALNLSWTAEGIETEEQLRLLTEMGCTRAQGFLLCKPLGPDEFASIIEDIDNAPWLQFWKRRKQDGRKRA